MKKLGLINKSAPLHGSVGQESVDLALAAATFGQQVSVFFIADGVFQLIAEQNPTLVECKDFTKSFGAFEFYDIENIYVCQQSIKDRDIDVSAIKLDITIMGSDALQLALSEQHNLLVMS